HLEGVDYELADFIIKDKEGNRRIAIDVKNMNPEALHYDLQVLLPPRRHFTNCLTELVVSCHSLSVSLSNFGRLSNCFFFIVLKNLLLIGYDIYLS
ncbi:MAG: hypothetical protein IKN31_00255, partial [Bacteroidales bacterium]|nr:hypothetical protein [Bacteroidales bacterium]